jgi:hypothetical protein
MLQTQSYIHTTRKRLVQVQRELKAAGKPFRAFKVMCLGLRKQLEKFSRLMTRAAFRR